MKKSTTGMVQKAIKFKRKSGQTQNKTQNKKAYAKTSFNLL